jgi:hypothetical protein
MYANSRNINAHVLSLGSQGETDHRQFFTCVGTYKGTIVAVKTVNKKNVEITRNIQKELKLVGFFDLVILINLLQVYGLFLPVIQGTAG